MNINFFFWFVNSFTILFLISPLFLITSYKIVLFLTIILPAVIVFLFIYFSLPQSSSPVDQFENITIAHRGGHPSNNCDNETDFPENTMAAYRWASTTEGADGIELDVWLSKDGIAMINHDGYLEHTFANCGEYLSSLTCEQLKNLRYFKKNKRDIYDQIGCEVIPTLEEVILFLEPTKLKLSTFLSFFQFNCIFLFLCSLVIEIKETQRIPQMAKIIDELFQRYPFLYTRAYCAAFHPYNIYCIRRLNPRITTALLFVSNLTTYLVANASQTLRPTSPYFVENVILRWAIDSILMWFGSPMGLKFLGANIACIERRQISQNLIEEYQKSKIIVSAWCVNEPEQHRWLKSKGVTIITDTLFHID